MAVRKSHAEVGPEDRAALIYVLRVLQVLMGLSEALLLERDVAKAPPGVVVGFVSSERRLVTPLAVFVIFIGNELVATECVGVCKILVKLDGPGEELERCFMFFQETVAVSDDAPRLRSEERLLHSLVAEENEGRLVLQVPEAGAEVFEAFEPVRF